MKNYFLFLLMIIIAACGDEENCTVEIFEHSLEEGMLAIDTSESPQFNVISGDNIVFEYMYTRDCATIIDDEWGEQFLFQISGLEEELSLRDDEMTQLNCVYREFGAWVKNTVLVNTGSLKISKKSATEWEVDADLDVKINPRRSTEVKFKEVFQF